MVKKVEYYECDCHSGTLEEISKTKLSEPALAPDYGWDKTNFSQTLFYKCDSCKSIYKRDKVEPADKTRQNIAILVNDGAGNITNANTSKKDIFTLYKGPLTEQEILNVVPLFEGIIGNFQEKSIVNNRP